MMFRGTYKEDIKEAVLLLPKARNVGASLPDLSALRLWLQGLCRQSLSKETQMTSEELAGAARYVDSEADVTVILDELGIDRATILYVTEQRGLRGVMAVTGRQFPTQTKAVSLTPEETAILRLLQAVSMDSICIGLAAARGLSAPLEATGHHQEN